MGSDEQTSPAGTSWLRRIVKGLAAAVLVALVLALVGKWWIIPAVVRAELRSALAESWRGDVHLADVEFRYTGPISLRGLSLTDASGRRWVHVERATVTLRDWPSVHPYLTAVDVKGVELRVHFVVGRCTPPVAAPKRPRASDLREYVDLQSVRVEPIALEVIDHDTARRCAWRLSLSAVRKAGGTCEVSLAERSPGEPARRLVAGEVDADTLQARLRVTLDRRLNGPEADLLAALLRLPEVQRLGGRIAADLALAGRLDDPASLQPTGVVALAGARAAAKDGPIVEDLTCRVRLAPGQGTLEQAKAVTPAGSVTIDASPFAFDLARGTISGRLHMLTVNAAAGAGLGGPWRRWLGPTVVRGRATVSGPVQFDPGRSQPLDFDLYGRLNFPEITLPDEAKTTLREVKAEQVRLRPTEAYVEDLAAALGKGRARLRAQISLSPREGEAGLGALAGWGDVTRLSGRGHVVADDVDLVIVPVLADLLKAMEVIPKQRKGVSDAQALLTMEGGVVVVRRGQLANPLSALEVEPGGRIDLPRKRLDLHVVVVPLKPLRSVLRSIPLINLAVGFRDKLTRFRIEGPWDRPATALVRKEPLRDLGEGTVAFFRGVVRTGGQLGPELIQGFGALFRKLDARRPPATSRAR
jgi:hypothetical protein